MKQLYFLLVLTTLHSHAECQTIPPLNVFLEWLFDAASNEVENIVNSFTFQKVAQSDISFLLFLPPPGNKTVILDAQNGTAIDLTKPTKFLIHGWQTTGSDKSHRNLADEYHRSGNYNVIAVDWSKHAKKIYMDSASSTHGVGDMLGEFILKLAQKDGKFLQNVHLIGVSLGGHVAGFAGQRVFNKTGKKIGRITGLDVASPLFEVPTKLEEDSRLSKDDAEFVDVVHTNAGFLGVSDAIGTADFYVENGGPLQPGCFDPLNMFESFGCSHAKAFEYFKDSIGAKKFEALSCPNSIDYHVLACNNNKKVFMGENVSKTATGPFYLESESPLPYSKLLDNPFGITVHPPRFRLPFIN